MRKQKKTAIPAKAEDKKDIVQIHFHEDGSLGIIPTSERAMVKFTSLMLNNAFTMMQAMMKKAKAQARKKKKGQRSRTRK